MARGGRYLVLRGASGADWAEEVRDLGAPTVVQPFFDSSFRRFLFCSWMRDVRDASPVSRAARPGGGDVNPGGGEDGAAGTTDVVAVGAEEVGGGGRLGGGVLTRGVAGWGAGSGMVSGGGVEEPQSWAWRGGVVPEETEPHALGGGAAGWAEPHA